MTVSVEMDLVRSFSHDNIVMCYGTGICAAFPNRTVHIVMERMDRSLEEHLRRFRPMTSLQELSNVVLQILRGLQYLHCEMKVIHRDLKLRNVLISGRQVKLSDFGISRRATSGGTSTATAAAGTHEYTAPEAARGRPHFKSDIWSLGILLFQLHTGAWPFPASVLANTRYAVPSYHVEQHGITLPEGCSVKPTVEASSDIAADVLSFVRQCLVAAVPQRAGTQELLCHALVAAETSKQFPQPKPHPTALPEGEGQSSGTSTSAEDKEVLHSFTTLNHEGKCHNWTCTTRKLGRGGEGSVYLGGGANFKEVAIKVVRLAGGASAEVRGEVVLMRSFSHPCIITCYGADVHQAQNGQWGVYIVMEKLDHSLEERLRLFGPMDSLSELSMVCHHILLGLQYLHHTKNVIHNDVKLENVLIAEGMVKLSDFGLSCPAGGGPAIAAGTVKYMSPEAYDGQPEYKGDVWSLGVLVFRLHTGQWPFHEKDTPYPAMFLVRYGPKAPEGTKVAPAVMDFVLLCLVCDVAQRADTAQLLRHAVGSAGPGSSAESSGPISARQLLKI